jgi:hypothetical protein
MIAETLHPKTTRYDDVPAIAQYKLEKIAVALVEKDEAKVAKQPKTQTQKAATSAAARTLFDRKVDDLERQYRK